MRRWIKRQSEVTKKRKSVAKRAVEKERKLERDLELKARNEKRVFRKK